MLCVQTKLVDVRSHDSVAVLMVKQSLRRLTMPAVQVCKVDILLISTASVLWFLLYNFNTNLECQAILTSNPNSCAVIVIVRETG